MNLPLKPALSGVGTDDGKVQVTRDAGSALDRHHCQANCRGRSRRCPGSRASLVRVSKRAPPISPSRAAGRTIFKPFVFRTTDFGATWTRIVKGLPDVAEATSIVEDTVNPNLLFLGTSGRRLHFI